MKKISNFLVDKKLYIFIITILFSIVAFITMNLTNINTDMAKYLPSDSNMKKGLNIMKKEFGETKDDNEFETFKIMVKDVSNEDKEIIYNIIISYDSVESINHDDTEYYNKDGYSLFIINTNLNNVNKTRSLMNKIESKLDDNYIVYTYYPNSNSNIVERIVPIAFIILIVVLILACKSFVEPLIILLNIGVAIIINMGTNFIFPSVSDTTNSIASVLQLILSIDYAIIFINRFRQEKVKYPNDLNLAMKNTVSNGFTAIIASSLTTFLGLLALSFMSFKIGLDMGLVLAKGVICSLICIFTLFPALLIWCNKAVEATEKKKLFAKLSKKNKKEGEADVQ